MKLQHRAALLLAVLIAAAGCKNSAVPSQSETPSSSEAPSSSASAPAALPLPGIDAESFPRIDGSTANHPLITRIYSEICGISREEAETLVDLDLGSTGSIWQKMLYGGESCLLIVYEPPEEVKEASAAELAQLEIDPIGRDGLVFLANAQNPVESLTVEELRRSTPHSSPTGARSAASPDRSSRSSAIPTAAARPFS